jgi:predicted nucleic acid-binding protein
MTLVDTTVWIDYFRNRSTPETDWLDREVSRQRLGLTDLILCEVLQGIARPREFDRTRAVLQQFEIYSTGGIHLAVTSAQNYQTLRLQGVTIRKTIDCLIASFCLLQGHTLLHNDRDYDPFERLLGLRVVHTS